MEHPYARADWSDWSKPDLASGILWKDIDIDRAIVKHALEMNEYTSAGEERHSQDNTETLNHHHSTICRPR